MPIPTPYPAPMLLSSKADAFDSADFTFEIKWDGVRLLAGMDAVPFIYNRRMNTRTAHYPEICEELKSRLPDGTLVDGELIALDEAGRPDFYKLLSRDLKKSGAAAEYERSVPVKYIVFDILYLRGKSVMDEPLLTRREILMDTLKSGGGIIISDSIKKQGRELFESARQYGLEGIVAKEIKSPYLPGIRSQSWIKIKATKQTEAAVAGYTAGSGLSLFLAVPDQNGSLRFAGKAGTGLTHKQERELLKRLEEVPKAKVPIEGAEDNSPGTFFIEPLIRVKLKYTERLKNGKLRNPVIIKIF